MRVRQIALVAKDLEAVVEDCCAVLGAEVAYRDPGVGVFGLENAVMPLGDDFLEVVSPVKADASAARFLARRGGDSGYMVILQVPDLAKERERVEAAGLRVVWDASLESAATVHLHPRDVGGAIVSLDWMDPAEHWEWAGPKWREHVRPDGCAGFAGAEIGAQDPAALAASWGRALGCEPTARDAAPSIELASGPLRFVPGARGDGLDAVDVRIADRDRFEREARARGVLQPDGSALVGGTRFVPVSG